MVKKITLLMLVLLGAIVSSFAQQPATCGTDIDYQRLKKQYPQIVEYETQLEEATQRAMKGQRYSGARITNDTMIYDIPVVVHILHDYGTEYLSDTAIYNAVPQWTIPMMKLNADTSEVIEPFKKYIGNAHIRFHLATIDPNGNPTKGITRHQTYYYTGGDDVAKLDDWPHDKYVNVWVVKSFGGDLTGAAAYARYPSVGAVMPYYDGVMTLYSYFNYQTTIPHEFGHVFNLRHVFGDTNSPNIICGDDEVDDTPPTKGHIPVGCDTAALFDTTCALHYSKTYKDIHNVDSVVDYPDTVNSQNIMDYTYCSRMFTKGQVQRMHLALDNSIGGRSNLYSTANLAATGAMLPMPDMRPVADFGVDRTNSGGSSFMCANNSILFAFKNASWNDTITNVAWTFSNGATTATSTSTTLVVNKFSQPGWVTVKLVATGNHTGNDTIVRTQAVYVADDQNLRSIGYNQDFANLADTAIWPIFNYYNNQFKWEWYNGAGYNDNACLRYHSFDSRVSPANKTGLAAGDYDDIFTPGFDLSGSATGDLNLNFYTAGSFKRKQDSVYNYPNFEQHVDSLAGDSLKVYVSTNCGSVWREIANIKSADLLNNAQQNSEFTPNAQNQWKAQTINIPTAYRTGKAFFRLRYFPANNSNNLYLDKFSVTPFATEVSEVMGTPNTIKVYPNPTQGACNIAFTATGNGKVSYGVKDITGRTMYQAEDTYPINTLVQKVLPADVFGTPGIYFITVTIANKTTTQKLVVQ